MTNDLILRIAGSVLTVLAGLGIGLLLRRFLVRRLRKTVLDDWLIQILGVIILLPFLLISIIGAFEIIVGKLDLDQLGSVGNSILTSGTAGAFIARILGSIFIVLFSIGVARTFSKITMRGIGDNHLSLNIRIVINRVSYIVVMLIAIFWVLALWQIAIEIPVAVLGTLTIAVTFSVQDILKDLVAGLYILLERPFFIGDQVSTDKYTGTVESVELRATRLRLVSGEEVSIPNALVFGGIVINNSRYAERRATILVTLPLVNFSRNETLEAILEMLKKQDDVMEKPEPRVTLSALNGDQVELMVRFWIVTGQIATVTDIMYALRSLLPQANLAVKEAAGDV